MSLCGLNDTMYIKYLALNQVFIEWEKTSLSRIKEVMGVKHLAQCMEIAVVVIVGTVLLEKAGWIDRK